MNRLLDAKIAVEKYGWRWSEILGGRKLLVPPEGDHREFWTAIWDKDGIPHYLPKYSEMDDSESVMETKCMWIVVVVEPYYPSVFHFENEDEALKCFNKNKDNGKVTHLAEVKKCQFNHDLYEFDEKNMESLDVEWYLSK